MKNALVPMERIAFIVAASVCLFIDLKKIPLVYGICILKTLQYFKQYKIKMRFWKALNGTFLQRIWIMLHYFIHKEIYINNKVY